jgi:hypothetical protein
VSDWHWASRNLIAGLNWTPSVPANVMEGDDGVNALVLQSGPADEYETASLFFTQALNLARQRIWIATPYFIPDEATMVALRLALLKGLDVRILTPELNDNWFVRHASNVYLQELASMGARIYFYEKGFMHQKVMLVDDRLAMVGTVNFDNRSFRSISRSRPPSRTGISRPRSKPCSKKTWQIPARPDRLTSATCPSGSVLKAVVQRCWRRCSDGHAPGFQNPMVR